MPEQISTFFTLDERLRLNCLKAISIMMCAGTAEWNEAVLLGLELCSTLLRTGGTHALQTTITAVALLVDKLVAALLKPR